MKRRARLLISGMVQGVFYRHSAVKKARDLGLAGSVCNLKNGRVEVIVEGEEENLEEFISWSKEGPQHALVEDVDVEYSDFQGGFDDFSIVR